MDPILHKQTMRKLDVLGKWRAWFAGWQLGTRFKGDPESDAVRDHREVTILLRCENSALIRLLIEKGVFTIDEWMRMLGEEADALCALYEEKWPGVKATEDGLDMNTAVMQEHETMKGWLP